MVKQVGPEHYLIRIGDGPCLYIVPLKVMVSGFGERKSPEDGSPKYAWEFYETKEDRERRIAETASCDTRMAVAKDFTAALLSPGGSERLTDAIRWGGGEISAEELANITKTARDSEDEPIKTTNGS
jgi:hypothetical protein